MNVVGAQTLLSWNARLTRTALNTFQSVALQQLHKYGGCVQGGGGRCGWCALRSRRLDQAVRLGQAVGVTPVPVGETGVQFQKGGTRGGTA